MANESEILNQAKTATVKIFNENFNYQDVADDPAKAQLDDYEVEVRSFSSYEDYWVVRTSTIFDDDLHFEVRSNTQGSGLTITIYQKIQSVSLPIETAETEE